MVFTDPPSHHQFGGRPPSKTDRDLKHKDGSHEDGEPEVHFLVQSCAERKKLSAGTSLPMPNFFVLHFDLPDFSKESLGIIFLVFSVKVFWKTLGNLRTTTTAGSELQCAAQARPVNFVVVVSSTTPNKVESRRPAIHKLWQL